MLAPETPSDQTTEMLHRLAREVEDQMGIRFRFSIADFPNAALTSEELLRKVTEDLQRSAITPGVDANRDQLPANTAEGARKSVSRAVVQEEHLV